MSTLPEWGGISRYPWRRHKLLPSPLTVPIHDPYSVARVLMPVYTYVRYIIYVYIYYSVSVCSAIFQQLDLSGKRIKKIFFKKKKAEVHSTVSSHCSNERLIFTHGVKIKTNNDVAKNKTTNYIIFSNEHPSCIIDCKSQHYTKIWYYNNINKIQ